MSFLRNSSGLVKEFKWYDAFFLNFSMMGPLASVSYPLFLSSFLPGANWIFSILFSAIIMLPLLVNYYLLSIHIPRTAGDYVFVSRALGGRIGVMQGISLLITLIVSLPVLAYFETIFLLVPGLQILGVSFHLSALVNAGFTILNSPLYTFLLSIAFIGLAYLLSSHKNTYRVLTIMQFISLILILISFIFFRNAYTEYVNFTPSSSNVTQNFVLASVFALSAFMFLNAPAYIGSELKNAKRSFFAGYYLAYSAVAVVMLAIVALIEADLGKVGYINVTLHGFHVPIITSSLLSIASLPYLSMPAIEVLLVITSMTWYFLFIAINFINTPRLMLALALDRILPAKFADVSNGTPTFSRRIQVLIAILLSIMMVYYGLSISYIVDSYLFIAWNFLIVAIASLKLSRLDKKLIIVGSLSIISQLFIVISTLIYALITPFGGPLFAGNEVFDLVFMFIPPILGLSVYEIVKRRNPDIELLFKEIPPE